MNEGKVDPPYGLTENHIKFLAVIRYLSSMPYRQVEGFTMALSRLFPKLPSADYSGLRSRLFPALHQGVSRADQAEERAEDISHQSYCSGAVAKAVFGERMRRPISSKAYSGAKRALITRIVPLMAGTIPAPAAYLAHWFSPWRRLRGALVRNNKFRAPFMPRIFGKFGF